MSVIVSSTDNILVEVLDSAEAELEGYQQWTSTEFTDTLEKFRNTDWPWHRTLEGGSPT